MVDAITSQSGGCILLRPLHGSNTDSDAKHNGETAKKVPVVAASGPHSANESRRHKVEVRNITSTAAELKEEEAEVAKRIAKDEATLARQRKKAREVF
jgi:hypothetical protein